MPRVLDAASQPIAKECDVDEAVQEHRANTCDFGDSCKVKDKATNGDRDC
jgi:predicted RecB family nuclease